MIYILKIMYGEKLGTKLHKIKVSFFKNKCQGIIKLIR